MKNKLISQLLIFSLLFLTWWSIEDIKKTVPVSGKVGTTLPIFPGIQIDFLLSEDPALAEEALEMTAQILIQYIFPDLSAEPWQSEYVFLDLLGDTDQELIISLSLPPDRGCLSLINKQNGQYTLYYYLDNLLPLGKVEKILLPGKKDILVTREDHNERMGAYTETKSIKLWHWQDKSLLLLWSENSFWEMNWLNTWENPDANTRFWSKLVQDLTVSYDTAPVATVKIEGEQSYYKAPASEYETLPPPYQFNQQEKRIIKESYQWNEEWQRFVLHTGILNLPSSTPQKAAVLKDMGTQLEAMVITEQETLYQIVNKEGRIFLANKKYIQLDK